MPTRRWQDYHTKGCQYAAWKAAHRDRHLNALGRKLADLDRRLKILENNR